jgi:hypothetical protein
LAERDLEYTPEDQAEEDSAAKLMAKLTEAFHQFQAQVKAAKAGAGTRDPGLGAREEAPSASAKPVTSSDGKGATPPSATAVDEANSVGTMVNRQPTIVNPRPRLPLAVRRTATGRAMGNRPSTIVNLLTPNSEPRIPLVPTLRK